MCVTEVDSTLIQLDATTGREDSGLTSISMHMNTSMLFNRC